MSDARFFKFATNYGTLFTIFVGLKGSLSMQFCIFYPTYPGMYSMANLKPS